MVVGLMDFLELAKKRYSVRGYKPQEVEKEKLDYVLEAFRMAPTACNLQPFKLFVIKTKGKEKALGEICGSWKWFTEAPLLLCVCALPKKAWSRADGKNYSDVDCAIAFDHLVLAATEKGLGTCWVAKFNVAKAKELLGIKNDFEPIAFTPLGYPKVEAGRKIRKPVEELVEFL
ncbi:malonic semialdehyde reductase RutE [uncultured archaeon]|nr:malonic semialdehyde reductase RutE [uncultured archaeon]